MMAPGWSAEENRALAALISLTASGDAVSVAAISQACDEDEFEIEIWLENWREFLISEPIDGEIGYKLYHSSFRQFLQGEL
ncbi:MAG: hypothetical protein Fur0025_45900 [Oscillatoriaceae cyanobacterium]